MDSVGFLQEIAAESPLRFPQGLAEAYSEVMAELRETFPDLDNVTYDLDVDSIESSASQLNRLFPTHSLKCFRALADIELANVRTAKEPYVLGWPLVTLVDVGCGAGAASVALLALVHGYQEFLLRNGRLLSPVRVSLIGIDASAHMLDLYTRVVKGYAGRLCDLLVDVQVEQLHGRFPQIAWELTRHHQPANRHVALIAMSNVVRALGQSFATGSTSVWERFQRALRGEPIGDPEFGQAEARAVRSVLEDWALDRIVVLGIVTSERDQRFERPWHEHLSAMTAAIAGRMSPHQVAHSQRRGRSLTFENPPSSFWRSSRGQLRHQTIYHYDWLTITSEPRAQDEQWDAILAPENLELAWARARRYATHEVLADEVEVLLFDREVGEQLHRLRKSMLARDWRSLNVQHTLGFDVPKKDGETRPKRIPRLEEQILGAAIVQSLGPSADQLRRSSYAYRLNRRRDEFLYEYWLHLWKGFLKHTHRNSRSRSVLRSDVTRFYENIEQDTLVGVVESATGMQDVTRQLLRALLCRDCLPPHEAGRGLPQGHIASGFWADLYLAQVDPVLSAIPGVSYARYADDLFFAIDSDVAETDVIKARLTTALRELGELELSEDKTFTQSGGQYLKETAFDDVLARLEQRRFSPLIEGLYRLGDEYLRHYHQDRWGFVALYSTLLGLVPIRVSKPWLSRKIKQQSSWWAAHFGPRLRFPHLPQGPEAYDTWVQRWVTLNPEWTQDYRRLKSDLGTLWCESLDTLLDSDAARPTQQMARRRLRFATFRLCVLGVDEIRDQLADLVVDHPSVIPVHTVCRGLADLGDHESLVRIAEHSHSAYVRAVAVRSLADVRPPVAHIAAPLMWRALRQSGSTPCEKLKASEGLLFLDSWDEAHIEDFAELIERETDPYILKNYILMMSRGFGHSAEGYLERIHQQYSHPIVSSAFQFVKQCPGLSLVSQDEPDALLRYYAEKYPAIEADTKEEESP